MVNLYTLAALAYAKQNPHKAAFLEKAIGCTRGAFIWLLVGQGASQYLAVAQ